MQIPASAKLVYGFFHGIHHFLLKPEETIEIREIVSLSPCADPPSIPHIVSSMLTILQSLDGSEYSLKKKKNGS
jgi:hypothetical protein